MMLFTINYKRLLLLSCFLLLGVLQILAQNKIKGKVTLAKNGRSLSKVSITIKGKRGTTTDKNKVSIYNYADRNKMGDSPRQINLETEITILKNLSLIAEVCKQYRCNILQNYSAISFVKGLEAGKINNAGLVNI